MATNATDRRVRTGTRPRTARHRLAAASAGALLLAACAGGDDTPATDDSRATDTTPATNVAGEPSVIVVGEGDEAIEFVPAEPSLASAAPEQVELIDTVVSAHGVDGGFVAVSHALARGYDIGQVAPAIRDGSLDADGLLAGTDPTRPTSTYMDLGDQPDGLVRGFAGSSDAAQPSPTDPRQLYISEADGLAGQTLLQRARDARTQVGTDDVDSGKQLIYVITAIAQSGYSMDQIIESLLLESTGVAETRSGCAALTIGFRIVRPAYPDVGDCAGVATRAANSQDDDLTDQRPASPNTAPQAEDRPTENADIRDGTYTGQFDVRAEFAAIGPEFLSVVKELENTATAAIEDGTLTSLSAVLHFSNPYLDDGDGTLCPSNDRFTMVDVPGTAAASGTTLGFDIELTLIDLDLAEADCEAFEETSTQVAAATMVFADEVATLTFADGEFTVTLTRS